MSLKKNGDRYMGGFGGNKRKKRNVIHNINK